MYYLNKSRNSIKKITLLKLHMNGLFNCHRVGWRKTAANWFGFKKNFYKNREREREAEVFTQYLLCVSSVNGSILGCRECWDILEYLCKASVILNLLLYSSYDKFHGFLVMTGGFYYVFIHTWDPVFDGW